MTYVKRAVCIFFAIACLVSYGMATEAEMYEKQLDALGTDELEEVLPKGAEDIEVSPDISLSQGLSDILDKLSENIGDIFTAGMQCVATIIAISMLCNAVGAMSIPQDSHSAKIAISLAGAIAVTAAASERITSVIGMGRELISSIDVFSKVLLPSVAAAEAACGLPGTALAKTSAAMLFSDVLITLINRALVPLMYVNIFTATANAAAPNESLRRISDLSVKIISAVLKFSLGAFVSYITVAGIVATGADRAGVKTAQLAAGAVPVVGGIISQAAETVIAGAALMKNCIGVFGMLAIVSACSIPFATLAVNYIMFKLAAVCAAPMIGGNVAELTERLGKSFALMLGMSASCVTVLLVSIISAMRGMGVI